MSTPPAPPVSSIASIPAPSLPPPSIPLADPDPRTVPTRPESFRPAPLDPPSLTGSSMDVVRSSVASIQHEEAQRGARLRKMLVLVGILVAILVALLTLFPRH